MYFVVNKEMNIKELKRILKKKNNFSDSSPNIDLKYSNNYNRQLRFNTVRKRFSDSTNSKFYFKKAQIN